MSVGKNQRVLLIGGSGFIGRHLVNACLSADMDVRVVDVVPLDKKLHNENVEYLYGDYRDIAFLTSIVDSMDFVVHLAHDTILLNIECDMNAEIERNISPAIQLLNACSNSNVSKMLFVSSGGTVYGNRVLHEPILESSMTNPVSVYGVSKLMIEHLGFLYHVQKNLPFIVARPGNAYGQGQYPFRGQGVIPTALSSAALNRSMKLYGDGSIVRDYVHVIDIANAIVALLQFGKIGESYNVGTSKGTSLRALIEKHIVPMLLEEGLVLNYEFEQERKADVNYNVLSSNKLLCDTGFSPSIGLEEGLRKTWEWIKSNATEKLA